MSVSHRYFLAYGSFKIPWATSKTGTVNFIMCRYPKGRVQWSKKMMPRLNALLRSKYFSKDDMQHDRGRNEKRCFWNVDCLEESDFRRCLHMPQDMIGMEAIG